MRRLFLLVALVAAARTVPAATIRTYDVRVQVEPSGLARVDAVIALEEAAGTLRIPAGFAGVADLVLISGPAGTTVAAEPSGTQTLIRVDLAPTAPSSTTLALRFLTGAAVVEAGPTAAAARVLRHALLNSQPDTIESYSARVILPPGSRAHAVREVLPAAKGASGAPHIALERIAGAHHVVLHASRVAQGDTVAMRVELAGLARSPFWMLAGISLSLLYLMRFRDLVTSPPDVERTVP